MMYRVGIRVDSINQTEKFRKLFRQRGTDGARKSHNELRVLLIACDHTEAVRSGLSLVGQP